MFGIGMPELIVILVVALLVLGPKKLPDVAKGLARGLAEFKKATSEIKQTIDGNEDLREIKDTFNQEMDRVMSEDNVDAATYPLGTPPEETAEEKARREEARKEVDERMSGDRSDAEAEMQGDENENEWTEYGSGYASAEEMTGKSAPGEQKEDAQKAEVETAETIEEEPADAEIKKG
jgi:sec-independent protein translocase protein TatB